MHMQPSRYNHFYPLDNSRHIAYNSFSNTLATIENHKLDLFNGFCQGTGQLPDDLRADLVKGGFLIEDCVDEMKLIRFRMLRSRFSTDHLALTILPTNDCNFRCG